MPFKEYKQNESTFLPHCLGDIIPEKDLVRVVNEFIDKLSRSMIEDALKKQFGTSSYHPRMMIKVILYGYCQRVYSCRRISKEVRQNINFMWLSGMSTPDFNTINRFRSNKSVEKLLKRIFSSLGEFLLRAGYISGKDYFVDGTKLEADASKFSYVWRKNTERFSEQVRARAKEIFEEADRINAAEDNLYGSLDLPETGESSKITSKDIEIAAQSISQAAEKSEDAESKKALEKAADKLEKESEKLKKYEGQQEILGERNSYSKTDPEATFMQMKNTEQLRAGYNVQVGTENSFVTGFSVGQNANDGSSFISHMESRKEMGLPVPQQVIGDSAYGTEENYSYSEKEGIQPYLKYPGWFREESGKLRPYEKSSFIYDSGRDCFICPAGKLLIFKAEEERCCKSGYISKIKIYECESCDGCPAKSDCTKSKGNRRIEQSPDLARYQAIARENLASEKGIELRKRRAPEVETVFAQIKHNMNCRRVHLRGLAKTRIDLTWIFLSYNLKRLANLASKKDKGKTMQKGEKISPNNEKFLQEKGQTMKKGENNSSNNEKFLKKPGIIGLYGAKIFNFFRNLIKIQDLGESIKI